MKDKKFRFFSVKRNRSKKVSKKVLEDLTEEKDPIVFFGRDVIIEIFKKLDKVDLKSVSLVSKKWYFYSNSNFVLKDVYLRGDPCRYTPEYFDNIIRQKKNIRNEFIMIGIQNRINIIRRSMFKSHQDSACESRNRHNNAYVSEMDFVPVYYMDYGPISSLAGLLLDDIRCMIKQSEITKLEKEYDRYSIK